MARGTSPSSSRWGWARSRRNGGSWRSGWPGGAPSCSISGPDTAPAAPLICPARRGTSRWSCAIFWTGSPHAEKLTLLAHSQGGLYAWAFARAYPELTGRLVLLDPLSPQDFRFRAELTETEFRKSGADKTAGLEWNRKLTRMHLGWLVKRMMSGAPPFYYSSFPAADRAEILASKAAGAGRLGDLKERFYILFHGSFLPAPASFMGERIIIPL